eukprot:184069_1
MGAQCCGNESAYGGIINMNPPRLRQKKYFRMDSESSITCSDNSDTESCVNETNEPQMSIKEVLCSETIDTQSNEDIEDTTNGDCMGYTSIDNEIKRVKARPKWPMDVIENLYQWSQNQAQAQAQELLDDDIKCLIPRLDLVA